MIYLFRHKTLKEETNKAGHRANLYLNIVPISSKFCSLLIFISAVKLKVFKPFKGDRWGRNMPPQTGPALLSMLSYFLTPIAIIRPNRMWGSSFTLLYKTFSTSFKSFFPSMNPFFLEVLCSVFDRHSLSIFTYWGSKLFNRKLMRIKPLFSTA